MTVRYRTGYDICLERGYLNETDEYYHNQYRLWREAALAGLQAKSIDLRREDGKPTDPLSEQDMRNADKFRELQREFKHDKSASDAIAIVCSDISATADVMATAYGLTLIAGEIDRSFRKLQEVVDNIEKIWDKRLRERASKI